MDRQEAIEVVRKNFPDSNYSNFQEALEVLIPELKESDGEKMKELIHNLITANSDTPSSKEIYSIYGKSKEQVIEWLEKQDEVKPVDIPIDFEQYVENILNLADGEGHGSPAKTKKVASELLQLAYKQKPAEWSEENEAGLGNALWAIQQARTIAKDENDMGNLWSAERWLKSLRPKSQWKPSERQMWAIENAQILLCGTEYNVAVCSLIEDLKKLKD